MPPDAVLIFDLDGTLSDPSDGFVASCNYALASEGFGTVRREQLLPFVGPTLDITFKTLIPGLDAPRLDRLVSRYLERYTAVGYSENRLYDGIATMLGKLRDHGYRLGVCTHKRTDIAERVLTLFNLREFFEFVAGGRVGISKSSLLEGLLTRGLISSEAMMIGDRGSDVLAAKLNGLRAVGVLWGFGSREELVEAQPDHCVDTPQDLISVLVACP